MTRRPSLAAFGLLLGSFVLFFGPLLAPGRTLFFRDVQVFFRPMKELLARGFATGELPWWNPAILGGSPFMANLESGLFYPPNVLLALFPVEPAFELGVVLHVAIAAAGMYVLHRRRGMAPLVAALPALAYAFGGVTLSMVNLLNNLQTIAWAPWVLLLWSAASAGRKPVLLGAAALLITIAFLAGAPVMLAITIAVAVLYGAWRRTGGLLGYGLRFAWVGALALLISAFQLLPTLQLIGLSTRHHVAGGTAWSMDPGTLLSALVPRLYFPEGGHFEILRPAFESGTPWLLSLYVGPFVLALAAYSLFVPGIRREAAAWLGGAGAFALLSMGARVGPVKALLELGLFQNAFRVPENFFYGTFLLSTLAAGAGFAAFAERRGPRAALPTLFALALVAAWTPLAWSARGDTSLVPLVAGSVLLGAAMLTLVFLHTYSVLPARRAVLPLVAFLALDLWLVNGRVNPLHASEIYVEPPPALAFLAGVEEPFRIQTGAKAVGRGETHGVPDALPPSEAAVWYRDGLVPNVGMSFGMSSFHGFEPMKTYKAAFFLNRIENAPDLESRARILGLVNVRYVLSPAPLEAPSLRGVAAFPPWRIYEVADALPRAFVRGRVRTVPTSEFPQALFEERFDRDAEVLLAGTVHDLRTLSERAAPGSVRIDSYRPNEVRLTATLDEPGCVVLLDADYPGWTVRVDGARREILQAYGLFRGVEVEAGTHEIVFTYRERRFLPGLLLTLLGLTLALGSSSMGSSLGLRLPRPAPRARS